MSETLTAVRALLVELFGLPHQPDDAPIFSAGVLDSMDVLQLIMELERRYKVKVPIFEVSIETFDSIDSIVAFVNGATGK